jgi:hypothetical protein
MAVAPTVDVKNTKVKLITWTALTTALSPGNPVEIGSLAPATGFTVQVTGTFGGATIAMQMSNDGTNFVPLLVAPGGAAVTFVAAGMVQVGGPVPRFIRPTSSGGAADTVVVTVSLPQIV